MAPHADDLKAQRVRQLLSNYYGSDTASNVSQDSHGSSTPPRSQQRDPGGAEASKTDLDSKEFSVDKYLDTLLREARLDKLLSSSTGMSSDIKSLDADMQRLVYENYNRFITATDTIRDLKSNLDAASPSMPKLQQTSEEIEQCREAVRSKLQQRQNQVADLNEVQSLLMKLESVFQLPQRLRVAIDAKAYALAVDCYISARPVLKRAGYKGALRRVAAEVEVQVKELMALLKEQVVAQRSDAVECIGLIRRLGGPVADLQDEFLRCMRESVQDALDLAQRAMAAAGGEHAGSATDPKEVLGTLQLTFFPELMRNSQLFTELFEKSSRPALIRVCRELLASYQELVKRILETMAITSAAASALVASSSPAEEGASADWGVQPIMEVLQQVVHNLGRLHPLLPELNLQDRAAETSEKCVRHHIAVCVLALRDHLWATITSSVARERPVLLQQHTAAALQGGMRALLRALQQYGSSPSAAGTWREAFTEVLQGSLQKLLVSLVQQFLAAAGSSMQEMGLAGLADQLAASPPLAASSDVKPASTRLLLFLAAFCIRVRDETVPQTVSLLESTFSRGVATGLWFDTTLLTRMLDRAFTRVLHRYTEAHSAPMIAAVRSEVRGGPTDGEPQRPRTFCDAWAVTLDAAVQELTALQEDTHGGSRGRFAGDLGLNALPTVGSHDSPLTISAVLPGIIAPALDAVVETLRLQTLSIGGLHQGQVDAGALKKVVVRHLATYAAISTLSTLEKIVIAASERCMDPKLLSAAAVEKLVARA